MFLAMPMVSVYKFGYDSRAFKADKAWCCQLLWGVIKMVRGIPRETRAKERVEREMEELKQQVEAKQGEIKDQEADLAACEASIHRLEQSLREQDVRPSDDIIVFRAWQACQCRLFCPQRTWVVHAAKLCCHTL